MSFFGKSDIQGVLYLGGALLLMIGLMSYSPLDPSLNSLGQMPIQNYAGYIGAFLSDLLYQGFGLMSYFFVFDCLRKSFLSFCGKFKFKFSSLAIQFVFVLSVCSFLSLCFSEVRLFNNHILIGGVLGQMISSSLISLAQPIGAVILLVSSICCCVVAQAHKPVRFYVKIWKNLVFQYGVFPIQKGFSYLWNSILTFRKKSIPVHLPPIVFKETEPSLEIEETVTSHHEPIKQATRFSNEENWQKPSFSSLPQTPKNHPRVSVEEVQNQQERLEDKLAQFSIAGETVGVKTGPAVTLFEFRPADSVKVGKITQLADDLSMALSAESLRIIAPIPGRNVVGIEASNSIREIVFFQDIVQDSTFKNKNWNLPLIIGKTAEGSVLIQELTQMPHLMVAGSTGSGKSVFITGLLSGLLMHHTPETLRLILVDPKQVDLTSFEEIPHLLFPPITNVDQALSSLNWTLEEMNKRYRSLNQFHARSIQSFNEIILELSEEEKEYHKSQNAHPSENDYYYKPLPYICLVVEEFGDLMVGPKKIQVEQSIVRLAQMARACGIHLILAMQSPRKDVVTGLIKTNIPGRISFKVSSKIDSRVILDESGAERLLARGDMLFLSPQEAKLKRCHGPFISEETIQLIVDHWKDQGLPQYKTLKENSNKFFGETESFDEDKEIYMQVKNYILSSCKEVSTSSLQRKFRLGYPRAARIMEILENEGVVGPAQGSKPREVLK